jgi:hypothetical protein
VRSTIRHGWLRHAYRATALTTILAMTVSTARVHAEDKPAPSNLELLSQMTTAIAEELYGKFGPETDGRAVRLQPYSSGEDYVFVGNVFMDVLTKHKVKTIAAATPGVSAPPALGSAAVPNPSVVPNTTPSTAAPDSAAVVSTGPASGAPGDVVLTFQNVAFAIAYPDVYRSHLIGGKRVKRRADIRVHATLTDAKSGEVLWVGEAARESSDEFDYDDAARVEQGVYQFARPVLPGGGWGKYAEPVFVTGIIVGLIYLFFSNQSDN